jgi:hypothetical protein
MADSKISQLNFADQIYDHDLMVVVTGYGSEGSYPDNCKISVDRIRKDIIRLDEMIFFLSGFSGYYNTGENTFTITSHHRMGNLIELDYDDVTPYIQTISTTGINLKTENLMVRNFENTWPYSGVIYNTGLNARAGNNIEIDFSTNRHTNMGSPYYSGTISTTGLNMIASTGIQYSVSNTWPHPYIVSQLDLKAVANNTFTCGPTTSTATFADSGLYRNVDWSLSNSKPLIDNASSYCYIIEFFINSFTLSNDPVPSPDSKGRPTTFNGNTVSWNTCNTTITPAIVTIAMSGNNIINTNPSSNPTYNASNSDIYLKYIEKRNLNSTARVQPRYTINPASYTRDCTGTYDGGTTSWSDSGILETSLEVGPYRHLKLDFAELTVS